MTTATKPVTIVTYQCSSDSRCHLQQACLNYQKVVISSAALPAPVSHQQPLQVTHIVWMPGRTVMRGKKTAHTGAHAHTLRALPASVFPTSAT